MDMTLESCRRFVEVLASDAPAPGGGGAAALVGAIGTALGNMVGSLTVGKKKYADVQDEIIALKAKCDDLLGPPGKSFGESSRKAEEIQASNGNLREQNAASLDV